MRRLLAVLVLAVGLGVLAAPAAALENDVNGPGCTDISGGDWGYRTIDGNRTLTVEAFLAAPGCNQFDYALVVNGADGLAPTDTCAVEGAAGCVKWVINFGPSGPDVACFSVTTSVGKGNHVFDVAPDVGCQAVTIEGSG